MKITINKISIKEKNNRAINVSYLKKRVYEFIFSILVISYLTC